MSADLLAEFDSFYQAPQDSKNQSTPASNDLSFLSNTDGKIQGGLGQAPQWQVPAAKPNDNAWGNFPSFQPPAAQASTSQDDIWGSFEAAEETANSPAQLHKAPMSLNSSTVTVNREQSRPTMSRRDTLEIFSSATGEWGSNTSFQVTSPPESIPKPTLNRKSSSGGDILFDADALSEDEDDFGDFESGVTSESSAPVPTPSQPPQSLESLFGVTSIQKKQPPKRPVDLLPTSPTSPPLPYPQAPKSPSFQERNPFAELGISTNKLSSIKQDSRGASPITAWPTFEPAVSKPAPYEDSPAPNDPDESWGDFTDLPADSPSSKPPVRPTTGIEADAWAWDEADRVEEKTASKAAEYPPPTNIPPPSVILPLFIPLFDLPQSALFKPVANQSFSLKNRILSDPSTIEFLRAYLMIATVAARVIAGRKLRWKRDTLLSQAMKIGPAAAGGKGGMKLMGVDKSEATREDQEATDVVRIWKDQLGRLKSAIAVANTSIQEPASHLVIPEINETMHVKSQEGTLTAPKPCIICGLKRNERIAKVDIHVEDSFGEWWKDHWGHTSCRNFWLEHESKLKHR